MVQCFICKENFKNITGLQNHVKSKHKEIQVDDFYDKFISKKEKPKCVFCGNVSYFNGFKRGYKKICQTDECISKSRATYTLEYGIKMEGLSENEAIERLENLNKKRKKTFKKTINEILKENPNFNKEKSHQCIEYWIKRGYSVSEAKENVVEVLNNLHKKTWEKRKQNPDLYKDINTSQILYWIKKGYNEEEARNKVSERQETFSKKICIKKYGYEKGMEIFLERQEKWIESLNKNGKLKVGYSEISQELFRNLDDNDYVFYGEKNHEYNIKNRRYDYTDLNKRKMIEFNGDVYHGNPKLFKKYDRPHPYLKHLTAEDLWDIDLFKKRLAESRDFELLVIWESDYKDNKNAVIKRCKEFLKK